MTTMLEQQARRQDALQEQVHALRAARCARAYTYGAFAHAHALHAHGHAYAHAHAHALAHARGTRTNGAEMLLCT